MTEGGSIEGVYPETRPDAWRANDRNMNIRATHESINNKHLKLKDIFNSEIDKAREELINELQTKGYSEKFATVRLTDLDATSESSRINAENAIKVTVQDTLQRNNPMFDTVLTHPLTGEQLAQEQELTREIEAQWVELYQTPSEKKLQRRLEREVDKKYSREIKRLNRLGLSLSNFYPEIDESDEETRVELFKNKLQTDIVSNNRSYQQLKRPLTPWDYKVQTVIDDYDQAVSDWDRALAVVIEKDPSEIDKKRVKDTRQYMDQIKAVLRDYFENQKNIDRYSTQMLPLELAKLDKKYGRLTPDEAKAMETLELADAEAYISMKRATGPVQMPRRIPLPSSLPTTDQSHTDSVVGGRYRLNGREYLTRPRQRTFSEGVAMRQNNIEVRNRSQNEPSLDIYRNIDDNTVIDQITNSQRPLGTVDAIPDAPIDPPFIIDRLEPITTRVTRLGSERVIKPKVDTNIPPLGLGGERIINFGAPLLGGQGGGGEEATEPQPEQVMENLQNSIKRAQDSNQDPEVIRKLKERLAALQEVERARLDNQSDDVIGKLNNEYEKIIQKPDLTENGKEQVFVGITDENKQKFLDLADELFSVTEDENNQVNFSQKVYTDRPREEIYNDVKKFYSEVTDGRDIDSSFEEREEQSKEDQAIILIESQILNADRRNLLAMVDVTSLPEIELNAYTQLRGQVDGLIAELNNYIARGNKFDAALIYRKYSAIEKQIKAFLKGVPKT